jgi:ankyrin repeat protein
LTHLFPDSFEAVKGQNFIAEKVFNQAIRMVRGDELRLWRDLEQGCSPNSGFVDPNNKEGASLISVASKNNVSSLIKLLIAYKVDVNSRSLDGWTALDRAIDFQNELLVRTLLENGAQQTEVSQAAKTSLHLACAKGNLKLVRLLVENGASVSAHNSKHRTPLFRAIAGKKDPLPVVSYLAANGASLDAVENGDITALSLAIMYDHFYLILWLLEKGANVKHRRADGDTMVMEAARQGNLKVLRALIDHNAFTDGSDHNGTNAIGCAVYCVSERQKGAIECIAYLMGMGVDLENTDNSGFRASHISVLSNHSDILSFLLEQGADTIGYLKPIKNLKALDGLTPISVGDFPGGTLTDLAKFIHKTVDRKRAIQLLTDHEGKEAILSPLKKELREKQRNRQHRDVTNFHTLRKQSGRIDQSKEDEEGPGETRVTAYDDRYHQSDEVELPLREIKVSRP